MVVYSRKGLFWGELPLFNAFSHEECKMEAVSFETFNLQRAKLGMQSGTGET
jgi:hypothetical protein